MKNEDKYKANELLRNFEKSLDKMYSEFHALEHHIEGTANPQVYSEFKILLEYICKINGFSEEVIKRRNLGFNETNAILPSELINKSKG